MRTAESLTDPSRDAVYDAIGMVPTRSSIDYHWYLHSLNIQSFLGGKARGVREMLEANPPAVFIPSYRTDWLRKEDWEFIRARYVPLADDFWVLGQLLPAGGGGFSVSHPGRYLLLQLKNGQVVPPMPGTLDGSPDAPAPVALTVGPHQASCPGDRQLGLLWIGPRLEQMPLLGPGDHQRLFVNWY